MSLRATCGEMCTSFSGGSIICVHAIPIDIN